MAGSAAAAAIVGSAACGRNASQETPETKAPQPESRSAVQADTSGVYVFLHGLFLLDFRQKNGANQMLIYAPDCSSLPSHPHSYNAAIWKPGLSSGDLVPIPKGASANVWTTNPIPSSASLLPAIDPKYTGDIAQSAAFFTWNLPFPTDIRLMRSVAAGGIASTHIDASYFPLTLLLIYASSPTTPLIGGLTAGSGNHVHIYAEPADCMSSADECLHGKAAIGQLQKLLKDLSGSDLPTIDCDPTTPPYQYDVKGTWPDVTTPEEEHPLSTVVHPDCALTVKQLHAAGLFRNKTIVPPEQMKFYSIDPPTCVPLALMP